jgi:uncharacterized protein
MSHHRHSATHGASRLDPRGPLVLDTRDLGRRAGSMRRLQRTVDAPAGLGLDVIGVPEGASMHLDLRLEAVMEGVLVTGSARAALAGECVRCLDRLEDEVVADFCEMYAYDESEADEEAMRLEGDLVDLEPALRDAVVLALPLTPTCRPDCPGLCAECGARLADDPSHRHEVADPRWSALQKLLTDAEQEN